MKQMTKGFWFPSAPGLSTESEGGDGGYGREGL